MGDKADKLFSLNFVVALAAIVLFISTYYVMMPVLPLYMKEMGGDNFQIGLMMGIFSAVSLVMRPVSGRLGDRHDPVVLMRVSVVAFFVTPLCFLAPSFLLMGLVQGIYGFTIGMFSTASGLVITGAVSPHLISQAIGIHSIACIVAKGISPTLGSYIYERGGIVGAVGATVALGALSLLLSMRIRTAAPTAQEVPAGGAPPSMLSVYLRRTVWVPSLVLLSVTFTFGAIMTMLPLFAAERGIGQFNLFFTVNTATAVAVRLAVGKRALSEHVRVISSLITLFAAVFLVSVCSSLPLLLAAAVIYGYGYGMSYPTLTSIVMIKNSPAIRGVAFGAVTAFFDVGVALGSAFAGLSEFIGFQRIYQIAAFVPLAGIALYALLLMRGPEQSAEN